MFISLATSALPLASLLFSSRSELIAMEGGRSSAILLVAAIVIGVTPACWAYDFYVGGQGGWVPDPSVSFNQWAQGNRFQINDRLVFRYKNGQDSVLLVRREDYETCNTTTPIKKLDGSGSDSAAYKLDRSGVFFFISGMPGRCQHGQKMIVVVMAHRNSTQQVPAPASAPSASLAPSPSVAASPGSRPSEEVMLAPAPSSSEEDGRAVSAAGSVVRASGASVIVTTLLLGGAFLA